MLLYTYYGQVNIWDTVHGITKIGMVIIQKMLVSRKEDKK